MFFISLVGLLDVVCCVFLCFLLWFLGGFILVLLRCCFVVVCVVILFIVLGDNFCFGINEFFGSWGVLKKELIFGIDLDVVGGFGGKLGVWGCGVVWSCCDCGICEDIVGVFGLGWLNLKGVEIFEILCE